MEGRKRGGKGEDKGRRREDRKGQSGRREKRKGSTEEGGGGLQGRDRNEELLFGFGERAFSGAGPSNRKAQR